MSDAKRYEPIAVSAESTVVAEFLSDLATATAYQSEAELERAFIQQLQAQAYDYLPVTNEAALIANLRTQLEALNAMTFSDAEWEHFFHEQIAEGNLIEKLEKHIDVVGLMHVADVPGRHQPGTGEINYTNIYRALGRLDYRHAVAMEFVPLGEPVSTLRRAGDAARNPGVV